jgi:hypothetical protein
MSKLRGRELKRCGVMEAGGFDEFSGSKSEAQDSA